MRKPHEKAVGLPPFLLALFASARRVRWPRKLDRATDSGRPLEQDDFGQNRFGFPNRAYSDSPC
jgi:hypothetical protein